MIVEMIIIRRRRRPPHFSQQSQEALRGWCKVLFEGEQKRLLRFALLCFRSSVLFFFFFCRRRALLPAAAAIINAAAESGQPTTTAEQPLPPPARPPRRPRCRARAERESAACRRRRRRCRDRRYSPLVAMRGYASVGLRREISYLRPLLNHRHSGVNFSTDKTIAVTTEAPKYDRIFKKETGKL